MCTVAQPRRWTSLSGGCRPTRGRPGVRRSPRGGRLPRRCRSARRLARPAQRTAPRSCARCAGRVRDVGVAALVVPIPAVERALDAIVVGHAAAETFVVDAQPAVAGSWRSRRGRTRSCGSGSSVRSCRPPRNGSARCWPRRRDAEKPRSGRIDSCSPTHSPASCCCGPSPPSGRPRPHSRARQRLLDRTLALYVATGQ